MLFSDAVAIEEVVQVWSAAAKALASGQDWATITCVAPEPQGLAKQTRGTRCHWRHGEPVSACEVYGGIGDWAAKAEASERGPSKRLARGASSRFFSRRSLRRSGSSGRISGSSRELVNNYQGGDGGLNDDKKKRTYSANEMLFWRVFPWVVSALLLIGSHVGALWIAQDTFSPCPHVLVGWFSAIICGTLIEWFIVDMFIIWFRNRVRATQKRIRTYKYQISEKAVKGILAGPMVGAMAASASKMMVRLLGAA